MSADNIIYVQQVGLQFYVWDDSGSNDNPQYEGDPYPNKHTALEASEALEKKIGYVEYGISHLEPRHPHVDKMYTIDEVEDLSCNWVKEDYEDTYGPMRGWEVEAKQSYNNHLGFIVQMFAELKEKERYDLL